MGCIVGPTCVVNLHIEHLSESGLVGDGGVQLK